MANTPPRRSSRLPHVHTPKTAERKKVLDFSKDSMQRHRKLPVVESESENECCDLGIISALDTSSSDDAAVDLGRSRMITRSHAKNILRKSGAMKEFIRSPYTLKNFQNRVSTPIKPSSPQTPHHMYQSPITPSSSGSRNSISSRTRARKSLASLIADTESCSSSLKDLNFDSDSGNCSKENTPTKRLARQKRDTPSNYLTFKGVLKSNENHFNSPHETTVIFTTNICNSPNVDLKTPQTHDVSMSPPKIGHWRKYNFILEESPTIEGNHKRNRSGSISDSAPIPKNPRLELNTSLPKARVSLFSSDKFRELLSAKSFYSKTLDLNTSLATQVAKAITVKESSIQKRSFGQSHRNHQRNKRKPGQINLGVRHRIKKPKVAIRNNKIQLNVRKSASLMRSSETVNDDSLDNSDPYAFDESMLNEKEKCNPFAREQRTVENLLSQWEDDDLDLEDNAELTRRSIVQAESLIAFNRTNMDESVLFNPATATQVYDSNLNTLNTSDGFILNLEDDGMAVEPITSTETKPTILTAVEASRSTAIKLETSTAVILGTPSENIENVVNGGFIVFEENGPQEFLPDLDAIENEINYLDDQIKATSEKYNIDADALLKATTENIIELPPVENVPPMPKAPVNVFPIFSNPDPGFKSANQNGNTASQSKKLLLSKKSDEHQYIIDAGQKKFGATQCTECGVIYQIGDPQDENDHLMYHNAVDVLRYNGFKDEIVIQTFSPSARCVKVLGNNDQKWKKVNSLLERVVHPQLGYAAPIEGSALYTAYLYIEKKRIIGCLIVEPKNLASRFLPGDVECCTEEQFPVKCGISRLWTHMSHRRKGIASRLVDCMRLTMYHGLVLSISDVAFSSPTPAGRDFAMKYSGSENFYVYIS